MRANWNATIRPDADGRTNAPDVRPPGTTGNWTKSITFFLSSECGGGVGSATEFAVDFVGVAMKAQLLEQRVGCFRGNDIFGGKDARKPALPIEVLAFDFALGLRITGVAKADAVEV